MNTDDDGKVPSDEELVALVLKDPDRGWVALWDRYGDSIYRRIGSFQLSPEDRDEAIQEFSFQLFDKDARVLKMWDPQRGALGAFLACIATNRTLDFLRSAFHKFESRKKDLSTGEDDSRDIAAILEDESLLPSERLHSIQTCAALLECMEKSAGEGRLAARNRLLLEARLLGSSMKRIAETLDISEDNVMKTWQRLKEKLKQCLIRAGVAFEDFIGTPK